LAPKSTFVAFFLEWATLKRWEVPDIHIRMCHFLENRGQLALMMVFRGAAKSTILGIHNAWRYWNDPTYRILHQGDSDPTAFKTSRDTKAVLLRHPWTRDWVADRIRGDVKFWWVPDADDERNPSMQASGIMSNITSSRADEVQNDDPEVPKNIGTPEAREKLRSRLSDQTHILVPGGRELYIGTPHTHDSLYTEVMEQGADTLIIRMYEHEFRIDPKEDDSGRAFSIPFKPEAVFSGIHKFTKVLKEGVDYRYRDGVIEFAAPVQATTDCYAGSAWPERFTAEEIEKRRRKCRTLNEFDSQYQLHAKPLTEVRLDPDKIPLYDCEPHFDRANKVLRFWLGKARLVGAALRWDPSAAKLKSDASSLALMFQDEQGRRYWHRAVRLTGEIAKLNERADQVTGGQVFEICDLIERYGVRRITVETNGVGAFAPMVLRMALKQRNLQCGVVEHHAAENKNKRILEAFEPLMSSRMVWAHVSVADGPAFPQMRDWKPEVKEQPDDDLDAAAGAAMDQPERIGQTVRNLTTTPRETWSANAGVFEAELEI
jgi:hypothetical protein